MMRHSAAMRQRIESAVDAKIASGTRPPSRPPAEAVIVARATDKTALAWAVSLGLFALLAIGNFAVRSGGMISLVLGGAAVSGCVALIRSATRRPVRFSWNEVREISVGYPQDVNAEERSLIMRMHLDSSVAGDVIGSNWTNAAEIDVPLDGLSRWQEIVATISAVSGRPLRSTHERAFPLKQLTDRVRAPSLGSPERGQAPQVDGDRWTRAQLASLWIREPMGMLHRELSWWRRRRCTEFSDSLMHEVVVSAGPGGRPGERLLATSSSVYESTHVPRLASDDSRRACRPISRHSAGWRPDRMAVHTRWLGVRGGRALQVRRQRSRRTETRRQSALHMALDRSRAIQSRSTRAPRHWRRPSC